MAQTLPSSSQKSTWCLRELSRQVDSKDNLRVEEAAKPEIMSTSEEEYILFKNHCARELK